MSLSTVTRQEIAAMVGAAVMAPSVLNTQPWRFVAVGERIDLYADRNRALPISDPDERAICISCGAALMNLRLAIAGDARSSTVRLLPSAANPAHLAEIHIGGPHETTEDEHALNKAIPLRRTSRLPFVAQPLSRSDREHLERAAREEGALLHFLTGLEVPYVMRTVHLADEDQRRDQALRDEVRQWINRPVDSTDGLPVAVLGPAPGDPNAAIRDFTMGQALPGRGSADFEAPPTLAVLHSSGDARQDWLVAGQALERVLLAATSQGLSSSLLTQPLEISWLRRLLTHPDDRSLVPHSLVRLGYGPRAPLTPRRPVADVLSFG